MNRAQAPKTTVRMPPDVVEWPHKKAAHNITSMTAEIVRLVRERMAKEQQEDAARMTIDWEKKADELWLAGAWLDSHARPGDDWKILVDGEKVYLSVLRASVDGGGEQQHERTLAETKSLLIEVREGHRLSGIYVIIPEDAQQSGGTDLLVWLTSMGWTKFHVFSSPVKECTSELVTAFRRANSGQAA
jgi:hypothetical protein